MESLQACLLVASPKLPDTNFFRSVVLMIQHDEEGAFGVVLNRPTHLTVGQVWSEAAGVACDNDQPVNLGGPVPGPLLALHTWEEQNSGEVLPGLFLATERDQLDALVGQDEHPFRLFTGYSGWGSGQLEDELEAGGWLTTPARKEHLFGDPETLWQQVADAIGQAILFPGVTHRPADPGAN
ncbi:YqgE/AlgH family protein [Lignipirellula cremea]|uniref:Uncharacterized protein n=1 Tax=Lignipirellula cremea TaxID=2528010 RepID=A0A518E519_9BACT|nr:YqgE/AlgH family protein [Lignipirellula cremea]QDU99186.1 hypothetical protein Pla8534_70990 [Lignipirellula cremea]